MAWGAQAPFSWNVCGQAFVRIVVGVLGKEWHPAGDPEGGCVGWAVERHVEGGIGVAPLHGWGPCVPES